MNIGKKPLKSFKCVLICHAMLISAALIFSITADLPHIFILTFLLSLLSLTIKKPLPYSDRSVIYSLVVSAVIAVVFDLIFPMDKDRFSLLSSVAQVNIFAPFLLYLGVFTTLFESSVYIIGICGAFSLIVTLFAGDLYPIILTNERFVFLPSWLTDIYHLYPIAVCILLSLFLIAFRTEFFLPATLKTVKPKQPWKLFVLYFLCVGILISSGITTFHIFKRYETQIRRLERFFLRLGLPRKMRYNNIIFSKIVDLNRTISKDIQENEERIVIRAYSAFPPGYLRGRVYLRYTQGEWEAFDDVKQGQKRSFKISMPGGILAYKTFFYNTMKQYKNAINFFISPRLKTNVLFAPGSVRQFDMVASRLYYTDDGTIYPEEWERDGGYTAFLPDNLPICKFNAYPLPKLRTKKGKNINNISDNIPKIVVSPQKYLHLSEKMRKYLSEYIKKNLPDLLKIRRDKLSEMSIIRRLMKFFSDNFAYSLSPQKLTKGEDPVMHFLSKSKKGHCELFASATVLILRTLGIPARYITGFVCVEQHPSGKYYVARLGNAHAWCELYSYEKKTWITFDTTPPSAMPDFNHQWADNEVWTDWLKASFQRIMGEVRRGYFAKAIILFFSSLFIFLKVLLWHPFRGPVILICMMSLFLFYLLKRKKKSHLNPSFLSSNALQLREDFKKIELFVKKKYKTLPERKNYQTLEEWLREIKKINPEIAGQFSHLFCEYKRLRFDKAIPYEEIKKFRSSWRDILKK